MINFRKTNACIAAWVTMIHHVHQQRVQQAERGATAVEYGLIVAMIAGVVIASVAILGADTANEFQAPIDEFNLATNP